jgi:[acyl-carrier-protein] S-malonyltransferase
LLAYLFPGQGSQYVGMGQALYASYASARQVFDQADNILGVPITQFCLEGPTEALNDTANTQPAILATSVALLRVLQEQTEEQPAFVAGHSVGEFTALVAAGALAFPDGLRLVRERGCVMKEAGERSPGGMAAVLGLEREALEEVCATVSTDSETYVGVANDNCPGQLVISGALASLEQAMALARTRGAKRVIPLAVSIAAHSPLMADASGKFRRTLDATPLAVPSMPIVCNATARPITDATRLREALAQQLTSPVRWAESVRWMVEQGVDRFVEVGPKNVLSGLGRRIDRTVESTDGETILSTFVASSEEESEQ